MNKLKCQSKPPVYVKGEFVTDRGRNHGRDQIQGYQDTRKQGSLEDKLSEAI